MGRLWLSRRGFETAGDGAEARTSRCRSRPRHVRSRPRHDDGMSVRDRARCVLRDRACWHRIDWRCERCAVRCARQSIPSTRAVAAVVRARASGAVGGCHHRHLHGGRCALRCSLPHIGRRCAQLRPRRTSSGTAHDSTPARVVGRFQVDGIDAVNRDGRHSARARNTRRNVAPRSGICQRLGSGWHHGTRRRRLCGGGPRHGRVERARGCSNRWPSAWPLLPLVGKRADGGREHLLVGWCSRVWTVVLLGGDRDSCRSWHAIRAGRRARGSHSHHL
mmetsp:Transcript_28673/g.61701  ORF Transcript_28673/g.61701 Transcript_28673/m.61701 type:complete len:277 (-) Transcript_28673:507-1337(-)